MVPFSESAVKPFCVNAIGCVPKKNKKLRLIVDLRPLNEHIKVPYFRQETIDTVCELVEFDDHFVSIDLKNGFHHIPVNSEFRKYLGFEWKGKYYIFNVLPFGLNISPYFFNKTVRAILISTFTDLGLVINEEKSDFVPKTKTVFIGFIINSRGDNNCPWLAIPQERIHKLKRDIRRVLQKPSVNARVLARICGQCISFTKAILPTKLLLRNLYRLLASCNTWFDTLYLDKASVSDLEWWLSALTSWNGRPIIKYSIDIQLYTDASDSGWGAVCNGEEASGLWTVPIAHTSINYRELLTVLLGLKSFLPKVKNKTVQILSDNVTTVAFINHLGGNVTQLTELAKAIWALAFQHNINLIAKHLPGILNSHADHLSRLTPQSTYSWKLNPKVFRYLDSLFGPHTIDRFADISNFQIPTYNSLYLDPLTSEVDALAQQNWADHNNFVNAPFHLIPKVLDVIVKQKATATVIAPHWPAQPWYSILQRLSTVQPLNLRNSKHLTWCLGHKPEPLKNHKWRISVWRLNGHLA